MKYFLSVCFLLMFLFARVAFAAEVEQTTYSGWKCLKMSNSTTDVYIAAELGGRIIQYVYMGHPFLWVNRKLEGKVFPLRENNRPENRKDYGGDIAWPAPQAGDGLSQRPSPGDDITDGPFRAEIVQKSGDYAQVRLTGSGQGRDAKVLVITELALFDSSSRLYLRTTVKNISHSQISRGVGRITQVDFSGPHSHSGNDKAYVVIPLNPKSAWPEKFKVMSGPTDSKNWRPDYQNMQMVVSYTDVAGKIGLDTMDGWAAMVDENSGFCFVQRFETFPRASYPDAGPFYAGVAEQDNPDARFVEMEITGPQIKLRPGESFSLNTSWEAIKGKLAAVPNLEEGYLPPPRATE